MDRKRIIAGIAALAVIMTGFGGNISGFVQPYQASAAGARYAYLDWIYEKTEDGVKLVEYTGKNTDVSIPYDIVMTKVTEVSAHIFDNCNQKVSSITLPDENISFDGNLLEFSDVYHIDLAIDGTITYSFARTEMGGENGLSLINSRYQYQRSEFDYNGDGKPDNYYGGDFDDEFMELVDGHYVSKKINAVVPEKVAGAEVRVIGADCFAYSGVLESVTLPDTICEIEQCAFCDSDITKAVIPDGVRFIPDCCFDRCTKLKEVVLPDSIIGISGTAFDDTPFEDKFVEYYGMNCRGTEIQMYVGDWTVIFTLHNDLSVTAKITEYNGNDEIVEFPEEFNGIPVYYDFPTAYSILPRVYYDQDTTDEYSMIRELRFSENLTTMPKFGYSTIEKVVFPKAASEIPSFCLAESLRLREITIPENIKKIGSFAFNGCRNLESVTIESDTIELDGHVFWDTGIKEIKFPGNCKLGNHCVSGKIESISFGAGDCVDLTISALVELPTLTELNFSPDIKEIRIGENALSQTGIKSLELGSNCSLIDFAAVRCCPNLKSVKIGGDVAVGGNAFMENPALETVTLSGKHKIGPNAFSLCTSLESFDFDEEPELAPDSFDGCTKLRTINGIRVVNGDSAGFTEELDDFVRRYFGGAENVGFIDDFVKNKAKEVVAEVTDDTMSDIEKAKALHDWICDNTTYAKTDLEDPANHVDVAVFMDGVAVCEGYSRTFNLLLNAAGIDSWFVENNIHSWNVAMLDGKAFHIDTTWDDSEGSEYWFLRSDAELHLIGGDHKTWKLGKPSSLHSFQSEELPECKDVMGDMDSDGDLDNEDIRAIRERLLSGDTYDIKADLDFNGRASAGDLAAAMSRMEKSRLKMGDVDGDGFITSADASMLLDEYSLMSVSTGSSFDERKTLVSDVNVDGQINAADATAILGYYTYISTGGTMNISAYTEN